MMETTKNLRVAALVDLPRSAQSGGHVKCWERLAQAAADSDLPLDLTVYFSGSQQTEELGPKARLRQLPPVFSTAKLKFLPYVPDHTDLAPYHRRLGHELSQYDVIHTTDGFFAFAKTAEKISHKCKIPLVTSFHTDTPAYTRIFTRRTIEQLFGAQSWLTRFLCDTMRVPEKAEHDMVERLRRHVKSCRHALVTRDEDFAFAREILEEKNIHHLRLGTDGTMFGTHRRDRAKVNFTYNIPADRILILFVGRLDVGKNIMTLIGAMENLLAEGMPLHLITAGIGPAEQALKDRLGAHVTVPGFVAPDDLAELYASVDVLALTSEVEIRSMAGVEAMASGCPVLVAEKSGVARLFHNTPAMRVVTGGVDAWTEALRDFASDKEQQEHMRKVATAYGQKYLATWRDVLAEDLLAIWQKTATSKK